MNRLAVHATGLLFLVAGILLNLPDESSAARSVQGQDFIDPGESITIDISDMLEVFDQIPEDERDEQIADWAIYGALMTWASSPEELVHGTFDRTPLRLPTLEDFYTLEPGSARYVVTKDGEIWLFHSAEDENVDVTLARLADHIRMETGEVHDEFLVFSYQYRPRRAQIEIARQENISGAELFSEDYGLVQSRVATVADLEVFLEQIDDITHVEADGETLVVEGRRFDLACQGDERRGPGSCSRHDGVQLDDVAALYQAQAALLQVLPRRSPGFSLDPVLDLRGLERDIRTLLRSPRKIIDQAAADADQLDPSEYPVDGRIWRGHKAASVALLFESSIFRRPLQFLWSIDDGAISLRPQTRAKLEVILDMLNDPNLPPWAREKHAHAALKKLERELGKEFDDKGDHARESGLTALILEFIEARNLQQCARYDGPLEGTAVGMTLFYTDALAKVWMSVDYHSSAPTDAVPGFLSEPRMIPTLSPSFSEVDSNTSTRVWFSPREDRYQHREGSSLTFSHIATQINAAGRDPTTVGPEVAPSESSRRATTWWNRHFQEVADHEQQFHRQNQIMKWSVITGWLAERAMLSSLSEVVVDHGHQFDQWYEANEDTLQYREGLRFTDPSQWATGTECMEILTSYPFALGNGVGRISGGVSLGTENSLARVEFDPSIAQSLHRGGLHAGPEAGTLVSNNHTTFSIGHDAGTGASLARVVPNAEMVTEPRSLMVKVPGVNGLEASSSLGLTSSVDIRAIEGSALGRLESTAVDGGAKLTWQSGELAKEISISNELTHHLESNSKGLAEVMSGTNGFGANDGTYLIEHSDGGLTALTPTTDGTGAVRVTRVGTPDGDPLAVRASAIRSGSSKPVQIRIGAEEASTLSTLEQQPWQRLESRGEEVVRVFTSEAPSDSAREVVIALDDPQLPTIAARIEGDAIYLERPPVGAPGAEAFDDLVTRNSIAGADIDQIARSPEGSALPYGSFSSEAGSGTLVAQERGVGGVLDRLADADTPGPMVRDAADEYRALARIGRAPESPVGEVFAIDSATKDADEALLKALASIERGDTPTAVQLARDAGSQRATASLELFPTAGSNEAELVRFARHAATDRRGTVDLSLSGARIRTRLTVTSPLPREAIAGRQRLRVVEQIRSGEAVLYVDESRVVGELDWHMRPGQSLATAASSSEYQWELLEMGDERLVPTEILEDGVSYERVDHATAPGETVDQGDGWWMLPVYLVRPCEKACTDEDEESDAECEARNARRTMCIGF